MKPPGWDDLPDGLYGDVEGFLAEHESGAQAQRWDWLARTTPVLTEAWIRSWLDVSARGLDASVA